MRKAYSQIFWGIIITIFNFRIAYINLLPNILGYLLIVLGSNNLVKNSDSEIFDNTYKLSVILLVILSIADIINFVPLHGTLALLDILFTILLNVLNLYFYYNLLLVSNKFIDVDYDSNNLRKFLTSSLLNIVVLSLTLLFNNYNLLLLSLIISIGVKIYLLVLISGLKNHYNEQDNNEIEYKVF